MQLLQDAPGAEDAPNAGAALATALLRLARLRAQAVFCDLPTLRTWANADGEDEWVGPAEAAEAVEAEPLQDLRGRFDDTGERAAEVANELTVAVAFSEDRLVRSEARLAVEAEEPAVAYGAHPGLIALLETPRPVARRPAPTARAADEPTADTIFAAGAMSLATLIVEPSQTARKQPPPAPHAAADDTSEPVMAPGAMSLSTLVVAALERPAQAVAKTATAAQAVAIDDPPLAAGAMSLSALLDTVPPAPAPATHTRLFDEAGFVDDMLANAFDALLGAAATFPADDVAWDSEVASADTAFARPDLAACEAALWDLPRHVPCSETFASTPNHETAVRLTRTLRLRANALAARAFADDADFGALAGATDNALWFPAAALADAPVLADEDASFPDWEMNAEGLIVVTAPGSAPPRPPARPLITEEELDALFEKVEESGRVLLDDLDETSPGEPYWSDVDSYLAMVSETMDPALLDPPMPLPTIEMHDIDVRDPEPEPVAATHFWMPGDDDLHVAGEGDDLFIVGGGDDGATVLVEDGATWAMRTGGGARMDEVVVSLSDDGWCDIDSMRWRRIATLSGVAELRVEQGATGSRRLVVSGVFATTGLDDDNIRLVRSGDDGEEAFPVLRAAIVPPDWVFPN